MPHIAKRRGSAWETRSGVSSGLARLKRRRAELAGGRLGSLKALIYLVKYPRFSGVSPLGVGQFPGFPKTQKL